MRRAKPNDGEERSLRIFLLLDIVDRFIDENFRTFAVEFFGRSPVTGEDRIHLEEIIVRKPFIKAHFTRVGGRFFLHRANMPLPKMPCPVSRLAQKMSHRNLLGPKRATGSKGSVAIGMPTSQDIAPGRRANRLGVEIIESQSGGGHLIEKGRLEIWMPVVTHFFPTMVISHQENDIRPRQRFSTI